LELWRSWCDNEEREKIGEAAVQNYQPGSRAPDAIHGLLVGIALSLVAWGMIGVLVIRIFA
jgi:hypothetical protein